MVYRRLLTPKMFCWGISFVSISFFPFNGTAQSPFKAFENLFTIPKNYTVAYTNTPPHIDGDLTDPAWQQARWTDDFVDIEGDLKPKPPLQTNVKMLWDDSCLYIAAQIKDPNVWAYLKHHDDIVFRDNDFEVFIDPDNTTHRYFEIEYNALNTIFDLFLNKPYRNGGNPLISWDARGMRSAVKVQGTINQPPDTDIGWTVEIALPFAAINPGSDLQAPKVGALWRINFSRVEWDTKVLNGRYVKLVDSAGHNLPEHNWVWSPQGVVNMHYPERWGYLQFSKGAGIDKAFTLPYSELQRQYLWLVYYQEKNWYRQHHAYNQSLKKFDLQGVIEINGNSNTLKIEAASHQFMAFITDKKSSITWSINEEGLIKQLKKDD